MLIQKKLPFPLNEGEIKRRRKVTFLFFKKQMFSQEIFQKTV
jgi:hypothetical protein